MPACESYVFERRASTENVRRHRDCEHKHEKAGYEILDGPRYIWSEIDETPFTDAIEALEQRDKVEPVAHHADSGLGFLCVRQHGSRYRRRSGDVLVKQVACEFPNKLLFHASEHIYSPWHDWYGAQHAPPQWESLLEFVRWPVLERMWTVHFDKLAPLAKVTAYIVLQYLQPHPDDRPLFLCPEQPEADLIVDPEVYEQSVTVHLPSIASRPAATTSSFLRIQRAQAHSSAHADDEVHEVYVVGPYDAPTDEHAVFRLEPGQLLVLKADEETNEWYQRGSNVEEFSMSQVPSDILDGPNFTHVFA